MFTADLLVSHREVKFSLRQQAQIDSIMRDHVGLAIARRARDRDATDARRTRPPPVPQVNRVNAKPSVGSKITVEYYTQYCRLNSVSTQTVILTASIVYSTIDNARPH